MWTDLGMIVYSLARLVWALIDGCACYTVVRWRGALTGRLIWRARDAALR